jgi:hypothetical protein
MLFTKSWDSLGYISPEPDFYEINYSDFGVIADAIPADCATALTVAGMQNRVAYHAQEIRWQLVAVSGNQAIIEGNIFSGTTSTRTQGCTEHALWPQIAKTNYHPRTQQPEGGPYHRLFVRDQSLVIYTTLTPCLRCCNSLIGISRYMNMNILVRCQQDYDFLGQRTQMDFTVMIPKENTITATNSPKKGDRAVFVLHNGNMNFSNRRTPKFKGSIRQAKDFQCSPHRTRTGATCGDINLDPTGDNRTGACKSCGEVQRIVSRVGSSTPWSADYDPNYLQNK